MIDKTKAKIGQTVFFEGRWSGGIIKGVISELHDGGASADCKAIVDENGNIVDSFIGTCGGKWENLYYTAADAYAGKKKKFENNVAEYEKEITDLFSLTEFALKYPLCAEEYTNYAAVEAYKRRRKELLS